MLAGRRYAHCRRKSCQTSKPATPLLTCALKHLLRVGPTHLLAEGLAYQPKVVEILMRVSRTGGRSVASLLLAYLLPIIVPINQPWIASTMPMLGNPCDSGLQRPEGRFPYRRGGDLRL